MVKPLNRAKHDFIDFNNITIVINIDLLEF